MPPAAGSALIIRRIKAPAAVPYPRLAWQAQPGTTFLAGSRLGTLACVPPVGGWHGLRRSGWLLRRWLGGGPLCFELSAPEDGILVWRQGRLPDRRLPAGSLLATYFPLRAWQDYAERLQRQDAFLRSGIVAALPAMRVEAAAREREIVRLRRQLAARKTAAPGELIELAEQLLSRTGEIEAAASSSATLLKNLEQQLRAFLKTQCPIPPFELLPLGALLPPLLVFAERLRLLDADYNRRLAQTPSAMREALIGEWRQRQGELLDELLPPEEDAA